MFVAGQWLGPFIVAAACEHFVALDLLECRGLPSITTH